MGETVLNWLIANYPWLTPTVVCSLGVWKLSRWTKRINEHMDKVDALPCEKNVNRLVAHDEQIGKHGDLLLSNNKMLQLVSKWIMKLDPQMIDAIGECQTFYNMTTEKKSPRRLNKKGLELLAELHGEEFICEHKAKFYDIIDRLLPKTAYDVELFALRSLQLCSDEDFFNDYKLYVYNRPSISDVDVEGRHVTYDMKLNDVCVVLSFPLRDMYLKDHPEIPR